MLPRKTPRGVSRPSIHPLFSFRVGITLIYRKMIFLLDTPVRIGYDVFGSLTMQERMVAGHGA
jgi:hypothetical protein